MRSQSQSGATVPTQENDFEPDIETSIRSLRNGKKGDLSNVVLALVDKYKELKMEVETKDKLITKMEHELGQKQAVIEMHEGRVTSLEVALENAQDRIVDLTGRSMDKNLVIIGLPEVQPDETEDLGTKIATFFTDNLKSVKTVTVDVCHRNGPRVRAPAGAKQPKPRSVTVMFSTRSDKNYILSLKENLPKKTPFKVIAQRPDEIRTSQAILIAEQKRLTNIKTKIVGERLINVTTKAVIRDLHKERHKAHDMNQKVSDVAKTIGVKHTGVMKHDGSDSRFQGHMLRIEDDSQLKAAFVALKRDEHVAKATHNAWALRLADGRELMSDNFEFGAAQKILDVLRAENITDRICVVSRWYWGVHMGADRFTWYENAAKEAVKVSADVIP